MIQVVHLDAPKKFLAWYRENMGLENIFYLCDYEFIGDTLTGLDLIDMTGIAPQAILITSR